MNHISIRIHRDAVSSWDEVKKWINSIYVKCLMSIEHYSFTKGIEVDEHCHIAGICKIKANTIRKNIKKQEWLKGVGNAAYCIQNCHKKGKPEYNLENALLYVCKGNDNKINISKLKIYLNKGYPDFEQFHETFWKNNSKVFKKINKVRDPPIFMKIYNNLTKDQKDLIICNSQIDLYKNIYEIKKITRKWIIRYYREHFKCYPNPNTISSLANSVFTRVMVENNIPQDDIDEIIYNIMYADTNETIVDLL